MMKKIIFIPGPSLCKMAHSRKDDNFKLHFTDRQHTRVVTGRIGRTGIACRIFQMEYFNEEKRGIVPTLIDLINI